MAALPIVCVTRLNMALHQTDGIVELKQPITERSNSKSKNIDTATPLEIIDSLHVCEEEIFKGWEGCKKIFDPEVVRVLSEVSMKAARILQEPRHCAVFMSGCGTSGRLAFFVATKMNQLMRRMGLPPCFHYIIAGGNKALTHSVEAFEDSAEAGRDGLVEVSKNKKQVLFIGITCGLSAAYVAGQLDHCIAHPDVFTPVLLGFNPTNQAKDQAIENWDQTCLSVTKRLKEREGRKKCYILNPVVGPEAITGSSRLKGGGATKLLLETCFLAAISSIHLSSSPASSAHLPGDQSPSSNTSSASSREDEHREETPSMANDIKLRDAQITVLLESYHQVWEDSYHASKEQLSKIISMAGESLLSDGHVYYIGMDTWGILGLIDASECPPTFGSDFDDVRGFLKGGLMCLHSLQPASGDADQLEGTQDETSIQFFLTNILPSVNPHDTIVFLLPAPAESIQQEVVSIMLQAYQKTDQLAAISMTEDSTQVQLENLVTISLPQPTRALRERLLGAGLARPVVGDVCQCLLEFGLKSALNAISTGAHIKKGKVFQNYMVDLRLSNAKLLQRGIGIVEKFARCSSDAARDAVMRSIYRTDDIKSVSHILVSSIIQHAGNVEKVVPLAIILAIKKCSVTEAQDLLRVRPAIRTALCSLLQQHAS